MESKEKGIYWALPDQSAISLTFCMNRSYQGSFVLWNIHHPYSSQCPYDSPHYLCYQYAWALRKLWQTRCNRANPHNPGYAKRWTALW